MCFLEFLAHQKAHQKKKDKNRDSLNMKKSALK
jgi:hypothetical protein